MGVTSKMTRMVLLCMLILSMVSLPTSLARKECTDFLEAALDVLVEEDAAWKSMGPHILEGMNAVMEKPNKGEDYGRLSAPRPHPPRPRPSPSPNPWWGVGDGAAPVTSW